MILEIVKSLYGLRRAPKIWRDLLFKTLAEYGLKPSSMDASLMIGNEICLYVYVNNILCIANDDKRKDVFAFLSKRFETKDSGLATRVLGIEFLRTTVNSLPAYIL